MIKDIIIDIKNREQSKKIQSILFYKGCEWNRGGKKYLDVAPEYYLLVKDNILTYWDNGDFFNFRIKENPNTTFTYDSFLKKFISNKLII